MPDKKEKTENLFEKWLKDFASERLPASLLRTSDPRLRERAGQIYRGLGFILCFIVGYLIVFEFFSLSFKLVIIWIIVYLVYLLVLEIIRFRKKDFFDQPSFRLIRIVLNILFITWLLALPSNAKSIIGLFYTIPIFALIVYFPNDKSKHIAVGLFVTACLLFAEIAIGGDAPLTFWQFIFNIAVLILFSYLFIWFQNNIVFGTDVISQISEHLYTTLDIDKLSDYIVRTSKKLAHADRSMIIIVDPDQKTYIKHAEIGFELKDGCTIEDVARKCYVINSGDSFDCQDMTAYYNDTDIYSTFFKCKPQSVIAVPLMNSDRMVVGVLNVASDKPNQFDSPTKDLILGFSSIASNAAENSIRYRQLRLTEIKGRSLDAKFARARDPQEIFNLILQEIKAQYPKINCVIHKLENRILKKTENVVLTPVLWDADIYQESDIVPSSFKYGTGLTGYALKHREPILANDVEKDPRYLKREEDKNIKSLLVCPLYDPNGEESYGVINLFSDTVGSFSTSDEFIVTSLAHQASLALSRMKAFEKWQEQGGILRKILNEVRYFDFGTFDEVFCRQLAEAATKLLGYKIARIRLLDVKSDELVTVAFSAPDDHPVSEYMGHRMPMSALEPFIVNQYEYERSYIIPHDDKRWREVADKYFYIPVSNKKIKGNNKWRPYDAIITPLINSGGKMIGLLTLDLPKNGTYPDRQSLEPISIFANVAAWAIQLSQYQRSLADQRNRTKSFIETISSELAQGHDIQTLGEVVVQICEKFINVEGCNLYIVKENEVVLTHSSYLSNTDYMGRHKPICSKPRCGLTGWVADRGKPLIYNNQEYISDPAWAGEKGHLEYLNSKKCESVLIVPVKGKADHVMGVITLENKKSPIGLGAFDNNDKQRLENIADQFSRAMERIGRYEAIKKWENRGLEDDLHFLVTWYRFGVVANIEQLQDVIENEDILKAKQLLPELLQNAQASVNELKALHTIIINDCLEAKNLKESLERLINAWRKRVSPLYPENLPMNIQLNCPDNPIMDVGLQNIFTRFASEALSNAISHSGIISDPNIKIEVNLHITSSKSTLTVSDNGAGIKVYREGLGFLKIKELAQKVNTFGQFKADTKVGSSKFGKGTQVEFSIRKTKLQE